MTATQDEQTVGIINSVAETGSYVTRVCFKHGPPELTGIELEWLLFDPAELDRRPDQDELRTYLGQHAPRTLDPDSPWLPLPNGGMVTVEPGGQIEISSAPTASIAGLINSMQSDIDCLTSLLAPSGFVPTGYAADPYRSPHRVLHTPRYDQMARSFDAIGPAGGVMMCSTAATQVCVDLGTPAQAADRWRAAHYLGPVLLAAFANSPRSAGRWSGDVSARMSAWWQLDPIRTLPPESMDPSAYADRALDTPVLARRRASGDWSPRGMSTLRDWAASSQQLTTADVDLHLSLMFPPVRPHGYLELRYLDAQPPGQWIAPLALVCALFSNDETVSAVIDVTAASADRWRQATECGLDDPVLREVAARLLDVVSPAFAGIQLDAGLLSTVCTLVERRLGAAVSPAMDQLAQPGSVW